MTGIWETYLQKPGWRVALSTGKAGTGDWSAFHRPMEEVYAAAERWKSAVGGVDRPWLCWNINDEWSVLQQKLVLAVGWTPVVGWDPNCMRGKPTVVPGAVLVDFNASFHFPAMWPHFPLDFAFLWARRLAFWHADLLVRIDKLKALAGTFDTLKDGELAAVPSLGGLRNLARWRTHRYWELIGCTTRGASEHQFRNGCSWWRNFHRHPNTPATEARRRAKYYYDSGVGIMYWKRRYRRRVVDIPERLVREGHCTRIGNRSYMTDDDKGKELALNFDLSKEAARLGLTAFLGG
jgi:hypothetical protein